MKNCSGPFVSPSCPRVLALVAVAFFATASLPAASYYVSTSGDDTHAGTINAPWKTIAKVNNLNLAHGDKIFLKGGDVFTDAGLVFLAADQGTAADPVIVDSYNGRATIKPPIGQHGVNIYNTGGITIRNVDFVGPGLVAANANPTSGVSLWSDLAGGVKKSGLRFEKLNLQLFYQGLTVGANHSSFSGFQDVVVTGCNITACVSDGIYTYGFYPGSSTQQSHKNLQVLGTVISDCKGDPSIAANTPTSGSGIVMSGTLGGLIDSCVAHDNGGGTNDNSGGGPVGIWCWNCNAVTIQHCLVYNQKTTPGALDGGGFDIDGGATNCVIQYCYSYNNHGPGYEVIEFAGAPALSNATVRYNVSWKDGRRTQASLSVWNGNSTAASCSNVKFYNNIVVSEGAANPLVSLPIVSGPFTAKFYNNIFYALTDSKLVDIGYNTGSWVFKGNLYYSAASTPKWTWGATTYTTLAAWQAAAGTPEMNSGVSVGTYGNPTMSNPAGGSAATEIAHLAAMTAFIPTSALVINHGQNLTTAAYGSLAVGSTDFKGAPIPVGAYDIGAYEKQ